MRKLIIGIVLVSCSGCATTGSVGEHFQMSGTPDGIRSFGDTLVGALKTAKETPNARNQYFKHREVYESNVTVRDTQPGIFNKLFNTGKATPEEQGS